MSYKYGDFAGKKSEKDERYFVNFTEETIDELFAEWTENNILEKIKTEITSDVRADRKNEKWLNVYYRKI